MDSRQSLSKPFKKLKDKFQGGGGKQDGRRWSKDDGKGGEADVEGSEAGQRNSHPHLEVDIGGVVESGPDREGNNVNGRKVALINADPPVPTPSISHIGESRST